MNLIFKALADTTRRTLLDRLREESGLTLNELCEGIGIARQAATKHLALLEKAKLIVIIWHGREKRHYLNPVPIQQIYNRWIGQYGRQRLLALRESKSRLASKNS